MRKNRLLPHPLPPLRLRAVFDTQERGGEGVEILKEAGGRRPPASLKTLPLPRLDALAITSQFAGGGVRVGGFRATASFRSLLGRRAARPMHGIAEEAREKSVPSSGARNDRSG